MFKPLVMLLLVVLLQACAVTPPTDYDLVQDRAVSKLYKSITSFFLAYPFGQAGACEYEHFAGFYQGALSESYALRVRAGALPRNEASAAQYGLLVASVERLQAMHQVDCFSEFEVQELQASFDGLFGAVLRLELDKKYGE